MPGLIQRVPPGLANVLGVYGAEQPNRLLDEVRATMDLLQFYALNQRQYRSSTDAAMAEGGSVGLTLSPAQSNQWALLIGLDFGVLKTATMTALSTSLLMGRPGTATLITVAANEFQRFGATETGYARVVYRPDTPVICPPGSTIFGAIDILGTDATCNGTITAEWGLLG